MAGLTVLNEPEVRALLENLTYDEFESFRDPLRAALHDYSTGTQSSQNADIHQPRRTAITSSSNGSEVMFVPSSNIGGVSMKVLTLPDRKAEDNAIGSENLVRARGAITLYNRVGDPVGFVPAQTVTAFRTALASTCLLQRRKRMRQITVFGCGEQAYWHVRLALLMRGDSIRTVNIINRRFSEHARLIFKRLASTPGAVKEREGWADAKIGLLTPGYGDYARLVEEHLVESDAIFCCTPSTEPLFDPAILTSYEARAKGRVIVAIGSYKREMRELPVELLRQATRQGSKGGHHHHHKHAIEGGVIVVDTLDGALQEAGEIIEAGLQPNQLVELGELVMLRRNAIGGEAERDDDNDNTCSVPAAEFERLNMSSSSSLKSSSTLSSSTTTQDSASSPNSSQQTLPCNESENGGGGSEDGSQRGSSTHHGHRRSTSGGKSGGSHHERKKSSHRHHYHHHRPQQSGGHDAKGSSSKDHETDHLARWMSSGNIVYKGVGLGLMDLAVGMRLIELAKEKGVGTYIEGF